jgi:hypothetical protein
MPKVSKTGKFRQAALSVASSSEEKEEQQLSRGQRKRESKKQQYLKRQTLILSSLRLKREEDQKRRIDGLDALKEALHATVSETVTKAQPESHQTSLLGRNKTKRELTAREVSHLGLVLEHPVFQSNPFATIQEHLKNTLTGQAQELKQLSEKQAKAEEAAAEKRKHAKKERVQDRGGKHRKKYHAARRSRK